MDGGAEDDLKEDYHVQDDHHVLNHISSICISYKLKYISSNHQDGGAEDNHVESDFARTWEH